MAESSTPTITNFAEFEAAGGRLPPEGQAKTVEPATPAEEAPAEPAEAEPTEPTEEKPPEKKAKAKPKLTLSEEHARLLKEVTELRRERRELQQPPAHTPQPPAATPAAADGAAPIRPKLSTFPGTLEEYEAEVEKYETKQRAWIEQQWERKQQEQQSKAEQQRVAKEYGQKLQEHLKAHPDYDQEIGQTPLSPLMVDLVLQEGPALGQALIDNKEEAQRIANLAPGYQILEMGKLIGRLNGHGKAQQAEPEAEPEPEPERVKVPAQLRATGGSTPYSASKPGFGARNFAEYEKLAQKYEQKRPGFSSRK